jgi:hypothetical protein
MYKLICKHSCVLYIYIYKINVWYFIKTFNRRILNSKIQIPLFWQHVSVQGTIFMSYYMFANKNKK